MRARYLCDIVFYGKLKAKPSILSNQAIIFERFGRKNSGGMATCDDDK